MLNLSALTSTPGLPGAGGREYPTTTVACALEWGGAVGAYARGVVPPVLPAVTNPAQDMLAASIFGAFALTRSMTLSLDAVREETCRQLELAFRTYAQTLATGMAATGVYTAIAPTGEVGFRALFTPPYPETRAAAVERLASAIDAWFRKGTAQLVAPPNTIIPWS